MVSCRCQDIVLLLVAMLLGRLQQETTGEQLYDNGKSNSSNLQNSNGSSKVPLNSLQLMVVLPLHTQLYTKPSTGLEEEDNKIKASLLPTWDRGLEILPAAFVAAEHISKASNLLPGVKLQIVPVNSSLCGQPTGSESSTLVAFIREVLRDRQNGRFIAGVTGLFCDGSAALISSVATKIQLPLLQLAGTGSPVLDVGVGGASPFLYRMVASSQTYCDTVLALMETLDWENIAIISEPVASYYTSMANRCYMQFSIRANVTFFGTVASRVHTVSETITSLRISGSRITLISTNAKLAAEILCLAYSENMYWPQYAWIMYDHRPTDLLAQPTVCNAETLHLALDGVIMLRYELGAGLLGTGMEGEERFEKYKVDYHNSLRQTEIANGLLSGSLKINSHANVLYDSVWAFVHAFNLSGLLRSNTSMSQHRLVEDASSHMNEVHFNGVSGYIGFANHQVDTQVLLYQHSHNFPVVIAHFNGGNLSIVNQSHLDSQTIPRDEIPRQYTLLPVSISIILLLIFLSLLLVSILILILFLFFRAEPEIKATSPLLSLNLFLGTYLLFSSAIISVFASAVVITNDDAHRATVCNAIVWTGSLGPNFIFTTLFVRMMRIYYIFNHYGRIGRKCSDWVLFGIILAVVSLNILLLTLWSSFDPFHIVDYVTYVPAGRPPYYDVVQFCYSNNTKVWLWLLYGKISLLAIAVAVLAVKTRKIKKSNFKDTKKVNAFVFLILVAICLFLPLWWTLLITGNPNAGTIVVSLVYSTVAVLCQVLLFVPKVLPALLRHFHSHGCFCQRRVNA